MIKRLNYLSNKNGLGVDNNEIKEKAVVIPLTEKTVGYSGTKNGLKK